MTPHHTTVRRRATGRAVAVAAASAAASAQSIAVGTGRDIEAGLRQPIVTGQPR